MKADTIFVQVASYRDPQLIPTLVDMIDNAAKPQNLHITVCWQRGPEETEEMFFEKGFKFINRLPNSKVEGEVVTLERNKAQIKLIDIHFHKTKGACWARNQIQQLYDGEKYTLQLDSHHRFAPNFDSELIKMIKGLQKDGVKKPLLTGYIPSFDPERDPEARVQEPWKMDFDRFIPEGAVFFLPSTMEGWREMTKPFPSRFYSAHFCFTLGQFCEEVQHDPEYFFHGEEIAIAVRAFTHGYDLFHPHLPLVWHEYTRKGRVKVWDDHTTGQKNKGRVELDWVERNNICHRRNRILFGMDGEDPNTIDFGKYGFGKERTLRQYEEYAGISFQYRGVQQKTLDRLPPPNNVPYNTEEEWKNTFSMSNDIRILLHRSELFNEEGKLEDDYDFFYVGAHDIDGKELHRKDLTEVDIKEKLMHEWIDYRFIFISVNTPVTYTIWPHSKSKGWLKKIDKKIVEGT
jgi:hypothetical protein